jgi:hypothetical protein
MQLSIDPLLENLGALRRWTVQAPLDSRPTELEEIRMVLQPVRIRQAYEADVNAGNLGYAGIGGASGLETCYPHLIVVKDEGLSRSQCCVQAKPS